MSPVEIKGVLYEVRSLRQFQSLNPQQFSAISK